MIKMIILIYINYFYKNINIIINLSEMKKYMFLLWYYFILVKNIIQKSLTDLRNLKFLLNYFILRFNIQ